MLLLNVINVADITVILVILALSLFALRTLKRSKKGSGCSGCIHQRECQKYGIRAYNEPSGCRMPPAPNLTVNPCPQMEPSKRLQR